MAVSASQVGSYFVQQYYHVVQQNTGYAHHFYQETSSMVWIDGDSCNRASGLLEIRALLNSIAFSGIEIKTIDSLESWDKGVLVVVSGTVKSKYFKGWRRFVQTFFLAPQDTGYFVMNDVFHFVAEEIVNHPQVPAVLENQVDSQPAIANPQESAVHQDHLEVEARENSSPIHDERGEADDFYSSQEQHYQDQHYQDQHYQEQHYQEQNYQEQHYQEHPYEEEHYEEQHYQQEEPVAENVEEETPIDEFSHVPQNTTDYVQENSYLPQHSNEFVQAAPQLPHNTTDIVQEPLSAAVEEPAGEPVKLTYASILLAPKGKFAPSVATQTTFTKSPTPSTGWYQASEPIVQQSASVPSVQSGYAAEVIEESSSREEEGESKSVYVKNLPSTVTIDDIFQEFKNFGRITHDGVFLKNRKDVGVCFAFVEFEDLASVRRALEASPIQLAGRQVYIEERRANSNNALRGGRTGRGGRGRGSYQDARGRGGYGTRGSYQDGRGNGYRN